MRLHDGRTGELREVELRHGMGLYVCGITPYDSAHLGHAFTYVQFDVLVRHLRHLGSSVVHVQNVTDVDDDILRVAAERGVDFLELARRENEHFIRTMEALGVARPTENPRATDFVPEMIEEVLALLARGCAYERDGTVYFRVDADGGYGRLSGLGRDAMVKLAGERGGRPEDPDKDDPLDFVLWQRSAPGEPAWDSPWGPGRPGWHIECSTMARRLLGGTVDVHGGGTDLVFPHHESELAQALAVDPGSVFVRHWMHTGMVFQRDEKMSKSLGNLTFVDDLLERYDGLVLRRFLLRRHYREDWAFQESDLEAEASGERRGRHPRAVGRPSRDAFFAALDDDLDTPLALAVAELAADRGEEWTTEADRVLGLADAGAG